MNTVGRTIYVRANDSYAVTVKKLIEIVLEIVLFFMTYGHVTK